MHKKRRLRLWAKALLALCAIFLITFYLAQINPTYFRTTAKQEPVVENPKEIIPVEVTNSSIGVYFCPRDDCEGHLFELLDSAQESIHCATYELCQGL